MKQQGIEVDPFEFLLCHLGGLGIEQKLGVTDEIDVES